MRQELRRVRAAVRLGLVAIAAVALLGQVSCSTSSSGGGPDLIPSCSVDGAACGSSGVCHLDDDDLCGGYCSPSCDACPAGTGCADSPDLCLATCSMNSDCPRPYQFCKEGFCASDENNCPG